MKHHFGVYLAGPITGLDHSGCTEWRQYVIDNLPQGIEGYSPMRAKQYLNDAGVLDGSYEDFPLSTQRGIYARDRFDCTRLDAVLVNLLGAKKVSIGTVMEIAWAADNNKPIVLVMEEGNIHQHPMVMEACPFVVDNIDEAIHVLGALLLPSSH